MEIGISNFGGGIRIEVILSFGCVTSEMRDFLQVTILLDGLELYICLGSWKASIIFSSMPPRLLVAETIQDQKDPC